MKAAVIHGGFDVRVEEVPDPVLLEPTDAVVRVLLSCICGSDLWPYRAEGPRSAGPARIGHEFLGVVEDVGTGATTVRRGDVVIAPFVWSDGTCGGVAPVRAYLPELLDDVLTGVIDPSPVFDLELPLAGTPDGYVAMHERRAIKTLLRP